MEERTKLYQAGDQQGIKELEQRLLAQNAEHKDWTCTEEMMATRQGLIDRAMYNWRKKPLIGNGFQVSDEMQYEHRKGFADYLSAPIEKGVWISAVLEEGGVIGLSLFCFFWIEYNPVFRTNYVTALNIISCHIWLGFYFINSYSSTMIEHCG